MAKISAKKSNLKTIANKIIVSPSTAVVSDLKFKRRKDFSTFVKWIESSNKALAGIKLPSKKEVEKLGKGSGGSNWLPALLALLGLGGIAALAKGQDKGDSDTGSGVTAEDTGATIPSILQGSNLTGALDITRQLNDPNTKINRKNSKIKLQNKKTLKNNLQKVKTKGNFIKNLKSNTLKNKFWTKGGTKPNVTNLGERMKSVKLKHGSKFMKVGSGKFSATPGTAPPIPTSLNKGILNTKPNIKTTFGSNIKNLFKPGNLKNLGKGFLAGWIGDQVEGAIINEIDKAAFHISKRQIDGQIEKHGVLKVYQRNVDLHTKFVNKKKEGFFTDWGTNDFNRKMADQFNENVNYIKINYKKELQEAGVEVGPVYRTKGVNYSSNILQSGKQVATIPFPVITSNNSGGGIVPVAVGGSKGNGPSNSSMMAMSGGVNSSLTDLLLSRLG